MRVYHYHSGSTCFEAHMETLRGIFHRPTPQEQVSPFPQDKTNPVASKMESHDPSRGTSTGPANSRPKRRGGQG